jgi:hypothetical protein
MWDRTTPEENAMRIMIALASALALAAMPAAVSAAPCKDAKGKFIKCPPAAAAAAAPAGKKAPCRDTKGKFVKCK